MEQRSQFDSTEGLLTNTWEAPLWGLMLQKQQELLTRIVLLIFYKMQIANIFVF